MRAADAVGNVVTVRGQRSGQDIPAFARNRTASSGTGDRRWWHSTAPVSCCRIVVRRCDSNASVFLVAVIEQHGDSERIGEIFDLIIGEPSL